MGASVLFAPGERPRPAAIRALAGSQPGFAISLDPAASAGGAGADSAHWLELLANGLTFDLVGLAPGACAPVPPCGHCYGLPADFAPESLEAIALRPGPHLAGGHGMLPVVRSLAWLAGQLAQATGAQAVAWHPARICSPPQQFRDAILRWTEGGAFPVFSLVALARMPDGGMHSEGLALFTGQELRLEPEVAGDPCALGKIAVRLLHWLAKHGPLEQAERVTGPEGLPLRLEPSANGRFARVWRG